jgi:acyl-CoA thioesterase I
MRNFITLAFLASVAFVPAYAANAGPTQIVALGDSNVAGNGVSLDEAWPAQLEVALRAQGYDVHVVNSGVSGSKSGDMLARSESVVPEGTKIVIVHPGGNDWTAFGKSPVTLADAEIRANREKNINQMIAELSARQIRVIVMGDQGIYKGPATGATKCGSIFLNNKEDGVQLGGQHLNAVGHHRVAMELVPCVERLIAKK